MKPGLLIFGALLFLAGVVWTLQGANVSKGSFMTGQATWLAIGLGALAASAVVVWLGTGRGRGKRKR